MKTTIEISDELLHRARERIGREGGTLRALVEEGLRLALKAREQPKSRFELIVSKARPGFTTEFADGDWARIKDEARRR